MTTISGLGPLGATRPAPARAVTGGFSVSTGSAPAAASLQLAAMPGLLALQEAGQESGPALVRDRDARRHAAALLAALKELQRALLGGGDPAALDRLAALARNAPPPSDPVLAQVQQAVLVRAAVEIARRNVSPVDPAATR